jgi:hypothetical protein
VTDPIMLPAALRRADVPICQRSLEWQSNATAELRRQHTEIERLREALTEIIRYAKGVHDPHLEELVRDFLKEPK